MYDVITFGSATRDAFFFSDDFEIIKNDNFLSGKAMAVDLGSKIEVDKVVFATGGGATNAAVTFARQGLRTSCVAQIGTDISGMHIIDELKKEKINTSNLIRNNKLNTAYSVIVSSGGKGRTILVHRGASSNISDKKINWSKVKSKWIYISSLNGNFTLLNKIFSHAKKNNIKIAFNPGSRELKNPKLKSFLKKIDILIVNQEEGASLTGVSINNPKDILNKLDRLVRGIAVMTRATKGVMVVDKGNIYDAGTLGETGKERTGAGDAFGSGFVSSMIAKNDIEYAIQFGSANATSTIRYIGAKNGLLNKNGLKQFGKVKVKIISK